MSEISSGSGSGEGTEVGTEVSSAYETTSSIEASEVIDNSVETETMNSIDVGGVEVNSSIGVGETKDFGGGEVSINPEQTSYRP